MRTGLGFVELYEGEESGADRSGCNSKNTTFTIY